MVTPTTPKLEYIKVPSDAMHRQDSYRVLNFEVMAALIGLVANQLLAQNGTVDLALIVKVLNAKNQQAFQSFSKFILSIFQTEVVLKNKYDKDISPYDVTVIAHRISMMETDAMKVFIANGVKIGALPMEAFIEESGYDVDSVREALIREVQERESDGIWQGAPTYVQKSIGAPGSPVGPAKEKTTKSTPSNGKPVGQPQNDKTPANTKDTPPASTK